MEALIIRPVDHLPEEVQPIEYSSAQPFIEANTFESTLEEIRTKHIIPVYSKDNERLISIAEFIQSTQEQVYKAFPDQRILQPSIRLSHPIKGRIPEAKDKAANELEEWEKTLYYERAAFVIEIPGIRREIEGNSLSLVVGGVKSYNLDRLQSRKGGDEYFTLFVGFQNKVCCNLCVWTDGLSNKVGVKSLDQLRAVTKHLLEEYNGSHHFFHLQQLSGLELSEEQFAQLIGRCRLYQHLPTLQRNQLPEMLFGDAQINAVVRDYYRDGPFCRQENGRINLWRLYNLFTGANKNSYIDSFVDRSVNAYRFAEHLRWSLEGKTHSWFLN